MNYPRSIARLSACLFLLASSFSAALDLPSKRVQLTTGVDFSTGKYGAEESTDMLYIPVTAKYATDKWSTSITIPFLSLDSGGGVVIGPDGRPVPLPPGTGATSESGLGDITASYTWFAYPGNDTLPIVDVTGRIKLPTADEDDTGWLNKQ